MSSNLQLAASFSLLLRQVLGTPSSPTTQLPIPSSTKVYNLSRTINENFESYSEFSNYYFPNVMLFDRYFTVVLFIIGFPGNFISFFVWSNRRMYHGNSAAVYLAALSLNDTVVLAIALFRDLTKNWGVHYAPTPGSCEALELINLTTQYSSPLFVLAFTIERWLAICEPFLVSRICSVRRALYICIGISTFTLLVCSPNTYLIMTTENGCEARNESVFYFTTTLEVIYSLCAPLLVLTFNCLVINEMAKIRRSRGKLAGGLGGKTHFGACLRSCMLSVFKIKPRGHFSNNDVDRARLRSLETTALSARIQDGISAKAAGSPRKKQVECKNVAKATDSPKFKSTTIMLLVVSFYVIFATLLGGVMYLLETKLNMDAYADWTMREFGRHPASRRALRIRVMKTVFDELALSHFAMGFVLYFSSGRNFRDGVSRFFQRLPNCCRSSRNDSLWGPNSTTSVDLHRNSSMRNVSLVTNTSTAAAATGIAEENRGDQEPRPSRRSAQVTRAYRQIRLKLPGSKQRKKEDFPGLQDCGRRGCRAPSRLVLLTQKGDPAPCQDV
nr:unnamed protein product [Spirometra erinaceieuropaei]